VGRRIIRGLDDGNKTIDDTYTMLSSDAHLSRELCDKPSELGITMFYCERPQHAKTQTADMAAPSVGIRTSQNLKVRRDFGIRRWLADAGCSSLVLKGRGKAYIRLRAPKYLNTSNGVASITKEMTTHIPQLDEMAEVLRGERTPAVLSVGKRCLEIGHAFCWPPFSENPFFIKPDGARITMEVEGDIPYSPVKATMPAQAQTDLTLKIE
jgi:hypothetical protein